MKTSPGCSLHKGIGTHHCVGGDAEAGEGLGKSFMEDPQEAVRCPQQGWPHEEAGQAH